MPAQIILDHFPKLNPEQVACFEALDTLYREWNARINVISRKDIDHLYLHHVLHSLAIARFMTFSPGTRIIDLGTGGGFPGLPLAILFPETEFTLIDGTRKKITVVEEISMALGLTNVRPLAVRAEEHKDKYDMVVTRAVAKLDQLVGWSRHLVRHDRHLQALPNGLVALKGGELRQEIKALPKKTSVETEKITAWFKDPWFEEKMVVWVQL